MRKEELLDAFGEIRDEYVEAAENVRGTAKKRMHILAAAACLILLIAGAAFMNGLRQNVDVPVVPGPAPEGNEGQEPEKGLFVPAVELPEQVPGRIQDMPLLVLYREAVYTQQRLYRGEEIREVEHLAGEYIGKTSGSIYEQPGEGELASNIKGEVYEVKAYDPDFRICLRYEETDGSGNVMHYLVFMDRLNGIWLDKGSDLFEDRLHLGGRCTDIRWQSHEDWNSGAGDLRPAEMGTELWERFLDALDEGGFIYEPALYGKDPDRPEFAKLAQTHLYLRLDDGTEAELRLIEGGYVGYQSLSGYFACIPGETFDEVFAVCGGTN